MGTFSIWHWLVVLAVLVLVFGTKKLRNLGGDLGAAVKGFKQGMNDGDKDAQSALDEPQSPAAATATEKRAEESAVKHGETK